ncbi:MAG TPA: CBS domain-containing protein [Kofleriaceae bacterium]|nr:CBS domain-containing protein [Kofleriaceae bacterium]
MKISEIMRRSPWVIDGVDTLGAAHRLMQQHAIRHLPVMRPGDKLVGLLSERDILEFRASLGGGDEWTLVAVSGAMTRAPQTVHPDDSLTEVAGRLATSKLDAFPVVERGKLVGIVSVTDVLAAEVRRAMEPTPPSEAVASTAMTPGPFAIRPEANLFEAADTMSLHGIRHLPVIDASEVVIGMISERDLRTCLGNPSVFVMARGETSLTVRDVMTTPVITVTPDHPVVEIAKLFEDQRIGAVPVVDREGKLVGIVSYVDALRVLSRPA